MKGSVARGFHEARTEDEAADCASPGCVLRRQVRRPSHPDEGLCVSKRLRSRMFARGATAAAFAVHGSRREVVAATVSVAATVLVGPPCSGRRVTAVPDRRHIRRSCVAARGRCVTIPKEATVSVAATILVRPRARRPRQRFFRIAAAFAVRASRREVVPLGFRGKPQFPSPPRSSPAARSDRCVIALPDRSRVCGARIAGGSVMSG